MGKYVVDGLLGPGGVTETYLVHTEAKPGEQPGATVELWALKLLRPDRVPEGELARVSARFLSAARQLRDFHRPGFCKVVDIVEAPPTTFMVSEYLSGCDLGRLLETCHAEGRTGVHPVLVGLIGSEVARLLHVGHAAKPVFAHLGLCPQNVMLGVSGEVTLLDAGMAVALRAITEQPPERWALVAPELQGVDVGAGQLSKEASARSVLAADLYALGGLLLMLLTGQPPKLPESSSRNGSVKGAVKASVVEVPELPGLTGKLAAALRTLLAPEPADRPEDAAMLVEWLAGDIVQVRDRQRLIAEGVRTAEKGIRTSSPDLTAIMSEPDRLPPVIKPAPPPASTARSAVSRRSPGSRRVAFLLAVLAVCTAAALVSLGWWPGQTRRRASHIVAHTAEGPRPVEGPRPSPASRETELAPQGAVDALVAREQADPLLAQVAGHLIVETVPPGAAVWVDGVFSGKTFADLVVGDGGHRVAIIAAGHRMFRDVIDTTQGAIVRRTLAEIAPPTRGNGFVEVTCRTQGKFPVLLDEEETGLLCPAKLLPTSSGKHLVGIFVPPERRTVSVETTVEPGAQPTSVSFSQ
jgi:serine/threonine protein kinase